MNIIKFIEALMCAELIHNVKSLISWWDFFSASHLLPHLHVAWDSDEWKKTKNQFDFNKFAYLNHIYCVIFDVQIMDFPKLINFHSETNTVYLNLDGFKWIHRWFSPTFTHYWDCDEKPACFDTLNNFDDLAMLLFSLSRLLTRLVLVSTFCSQQCHIHYTHLHMVYFSYGKINIYSSWTFKSKCVCVLSSLCVGFSNILDIIGMKIEINIKIKMNMCICNRAYSIFANILTYHQR